MNVLRPAVLLWTAGALFIATPSSAQRVQGEPPLPALSPEASAALDELSSRFAGDVGLHQGWFRDRAILYYDFGPVATTPGRIWWPIHGFDAKGNPVAMRGQRPIFSTLPGFATYSGLWRVTYVIVADNVHPNQLRDSAAVLALVGRRRAQAKEVDVTFNLALVPKGSRLERDSTPPLMGWFEGREVQFFDFGQSGVTPTPLIAFVRGTDAAGEPELLKEQTNIVDTLPTAPPYADMWNIRFAHVDSTYVPNTLKSAAAVVSASIPVDAPHAVRNCPIAIVDGARVQRVPSPITLFSDLRSPFPPAPTRPPK